MSTTSQTMVKRSLVLKAIVTEYFKKEVLQELKNAMQGLESNIKQMQEFKEKSNFGQEEQKAIGDEIKKLAAQKAVLEQRRQEVEKLKEGFTHLEKGNDIRKKLVPIEVLTQDFIIQEIIN